METSPTPDTGRSMPRLAAAVLAAALVLLLGWRASGMGPDVNSISADDMAVHLEDSENRSAWLATWMPGPEIAEAGPDSSAGGLAGGSAGGGARLSSDTASVPSAGSALGRPLEQIGGPAFWASHLLSVWTSDPAEHAGWLTWLGLVALAASAAGLAGACFGAPWLARLVAGILACGLPFAYLRLRGGEGLPAPAEVWALAAGFLGLWSIVGWSPGPVGPALERGGAVPPVSPPGASGTSSSWRLVGFAFALHSLLLVAPPVLAHDVSAVLLAGVLVGLLRARSWRYAKPICVAVILAFVSVAPVYLDAFRDAKLQQDPPATPESAGGFSVPLIVPADFATVDGPEARSLDPVEALGQSGVAEIDWVRSDQLSLLLPRVREEKLLVLPIRFHPMWRASFRGMVAQPLRVNGLYQGVLIEERMWEVDVSYVPQSPLVLFSQLTFGCLGLIWLIGLLRRRWLGNRIAERARRLALLRA